MIAPIVVLDVLQACLNVIFVVFVHHAARWLPLCIAENVALFEQSIARGAAVERVQVAVVGDEQDNEHDGEQLGRAHVEVLDEIAAPFVVVGGTTVAAVAHWQETGIVAARAEFIVRRLHRFFVKLSTE